MRVDVNWARLPMMLQGVIRDRLFTALAGSALAAVAYVHRLWLDEREKVNYALAHGSQVCQIEAALNDQLDVQLRRVRIIDAGDYEVKLVHRNSDQEPLMISANADPPPVLIHQNAIYAGGKFDFIVVIPEPVDKDDMYRIRALVDKYKLAGKRYDVTLPKQNKTA